MTEVHSVNRHATSGRVLKRGFRHSYIPERRRLCFSVT